MQSKRWWLIVALLMALMMLWAGTALAQEKTLYWERFDVDITIRNNGDFQVAETQEIAFTSGTFTFGYRYIPLNRVEEIVDVEVWENGQRYTLAATQAPNTYETWTEDEKLVIKWYFPPTSNARRTWTLRYTVRGGLRIYEGGDQLYWQAIYADRQQPINAARVTVHLPAAFSAEQLKIASYGADATWELTDAQTVVFTATRQIGANRGLEVRVQFPHGVVQTTTPSWQAADDRAIEYKEKWQPVVSLGIGALSALILAAGLIGVYLLWYTKGRDKPAGLVAEFISEPPAKVPPAIAGTLLDEKADMADIVATIVDLARRGVIVMEEIEEPGLLGIGKRKDFRYRLEQPEAELLPFERTLVNRMFGTSTERRLSELRNQFYTAIPEIQNKLYEEITHLGYFRSNPQRARKTYAALGIGGIVVAVGIGICGTSALAPYANTAFCIPTSLGIVSLALLIVSPFMPARTEKGSEEAAKWRAFKRYLENIQKYEKVQEATHLFDQYLPYAIAFGLEKSWIQTFANAGTPAPGWYIPYPPVIVYGDSGGALPAGGSGYSGSGPKPAGGLPKETGAPSLDSMSSSMFGSLSAMSSGLFFMLDSAAHTLSSAPSRSGGGGGWSGGGGGGGHGGGGGGGGFG